MERDSVEKYIWGLESTADDIRAKRRVGEPVNPVHIENMLRNTVQFLRDNYQRLSEPTIKSKTS